MNATTANNATMAVLIEQRCKCGAPGTIRWGDTLALTHGFYCWRCDRCAAREQLRHAVGRALAIPGLLWRALR